MLPATKTKAGGGAKELTPLPATPRYISAGFHHRSRAYPAGVPLDDLPEADLRELIASGQALPDTEPAKTATTEE